MSTLPVVLSFGIADASGATGVAADQIACASMGCHTASVVTAVAAAERESEWLAIDAEWVENQAKAVLQNMAVSAFKVGVLASVEQIQPIAEILAECDDVPVVLDPVLENADTAEWDGEEVAGAMRELLLPQTTVVVMSLPQARRFIALADSDEQADAYTPGDCARRLLDWGVEFALISNAELGSGFVVNGLYDEDGLMRTENLPRVSDPNGVPFRGAGDTLSAALAGLLAQGLDIGEAVQEAGQYTTAALMHAFGAGLGFAIPDRLFWAGDDDDEATPDVS
jgi:hydroxymethylpyrimidine/phosphomethylpyrimidine kinase